jgi:hypothetical protein
MTTYNRRVLKNKKLQYLTMKFDREENIRKDCKHRSATLNPPVHNRERGNVTSDLGNGA